MQQIYRHSDEQFEVYTTVFSPQVCRSRSRTRHTGPDKVVAVIQYQPRWSKELELNQGDVIQVLFKEDEAWWFGRTVNGDEGYFPVTCVEPLQGRELKRSTPVLQRRGSVPVVVPTPVPPCGCTSGHSTPKLLRKNSIRRPPGIDRTSAEKGSRGSANPLASPSLLHRVLAKSRRKSCPHFQNPPLGVGMDNSAFQPD